MNRNTYVVAAAAMAIGLVASACGHSSNSATATTSPVSATQLQSLIPTPANTQRTDGPTSIPDSGIHMHFLVNGGGTDVLGAYKTALLRVAGKARQPQLWWQHPPIAATGCIPRFRPM